MRLVHSFQAGQVARLPGEGFSSPIIFDGRVYVTAAIEQGMRRALICLDAKTGSILWQSAVESEKTPTYPRAGHAAPTPVTDGERIFAYFDKPGLVAFDMRGNVLWQFLPSTDPIKATYNQASSPILVGDNVVLNVSHRGPSYLFALDQKTGDVVWRTEKEKGYNYATPMLVEVEGKKQLILNGTHVVGYDAATGEQLWSVGGMKPAVNPSAVFAHGMVYASSGRNGPSMVIDPTGRGDVTNTHVRMHVPSGGPYVPSPIVYRDLYIVPGDDGRLTVFRDDGSIVARHRVRARTTASLVIAGDRLYWFDERARTWVLDLSHLHDDEPRIEQIACNVLPEEEPCLASPAIADGVIYLRTLKHLYSIVGGEAKLAPPPSGDLPDDYEALKAFYVAQPSKELDDTMLRLDIVEKLSHMDDPRVVELLALIIETDGHWDVSEAAARELGRHGEAAVPHLVALLEKPRAQPFFKTVAAEQLSHIRSPAAVDALITAATYERNRPPVRAAATLALAETIDAHGEKAPAAFDAVLPLLEHESGVVRHAAVTALGIMARQAGDRREVAVDALRKAVDDAHGLTAGAARRALKRSYRAELP